MDCRPDADGWDHLKEHYEACFDRAGPTPEGVDWPTADDLEVRFAVQLGVLERCPPDRPAELLDLGCGPGLLLDFLSASGWADRVHYAGIDLSRAMIKCAQSRWPSQRFAVRDIVRKPLSERSVDVVVMNGVMTERRSLPVSVMEKMAKDLVAAAFAACRVGIAFNVMSKHVDWERDDLFHWEFDRLAAFLTQHVSRHIEFKADYGLYEYTAFVWREPLRPRLVGRPEWWVR